MSAMWSVSAKTAQAFRLLLSPNGLRRISPSKCLSCGGGTFVLRRVEGFRKARGIVVKDICEICYGTGKFKETNVRMKEG